MTYHPFVLRLAALGIQPVPEWKQQPVLAEQAANSNKFEFEVFLIYQKQHEF